MTAPPRPYLGPTGTSVAAAFLILVAGLALLVAVALPINQLTQPGGSVVITSAALDQDEERSLGLAGLPEGVSVADRTSEAVLRAFELPAGLRALTELPASSRGIALAVGAWLLAQVLTSISAGRPFDRRNPRRLAGIAAAVVLGGVVAPMTEHMAATAVLEHLGLTGDRSPVGPVGVLVPVAPVVVVLALLSVAEAFRRGSALEDEVEGMV